MLRRCAGNMISMIFFSIFKCCRIAVCVSDLVCSLVNSLDWKASGCSALSGFSTSSRFGWRTVSLMHTQNSILIVRLLLEWLPAACRWFPVVASGLLAEDCVHTIFGCFNPFDTYEEGRDGPIRKTVNKKVHCSSTVGETNLVWTVRHRFRAEFQAEIERRAISHFVRLM